MHDKDQHRTGGLTGQTGASSVIRVDVASRTGEFHGGATGMLYGLGDRGVPSRALIQGARPRTVAQRAPSGRQHPTGDAIRVADDFFAAGGEELLVYMQDVYAEWPYEQLGIEDYLPKIEAMVRVVAARPDRDRFTWVPFNEPDWIWYGDWDTDRPRFFHDWAAVVHTIRSALPAAKIVGPNEMRFNPQRLTDFLTWAAPRGLLPDVMSWHELEPSGLREYPQHYAGYRRIEADLGIGPLPINIDEYGNRRDFSVPARLLQWIAMFEETKVDADMAYWTFAGNLDDHAVRGAQANGGWWLLKWYADLRGHTLAVTRDEARSRAIAVLDPLAAQVTVLVAGSMNDGWLELSGVDSDRFGEWIDVSESIVSWTGYEGAAAESPQSSRVRVESTSPVLIPVPAGDPLAVHRFVISTAELDADPRRASRLHVFEAENAETVGGTLRRHDDDPQKYTASSGADVSGLGEVGSSVTFEVTAPSTSTWRIGIFYATDKRVGQHALEIDGVRRVVVDYPATLSDTYRGRVDVDLSLDAGPHTLRLRALEDGPRSVISIDRITVSQPTAGEDVVTARSWRRSGGATLLSGGVDRRPVVRLEPGSRVRGFLTAASSGYHDVVLEGHGDGVLSVEIGGRAVLDRVHLSPDASARARVHLGLGISTIDIMVKSGSFDLEAVRTFPALGAGAAFPWVDERRGADPAIEVIERNVGPVGEIDLVLRYSNAAVEGDHEYNTDVVSAELTVEVGTRPGIEVRFGPTHSWSSTAETVVPLHRDVEERVVIWAGRPAPRIAGTRVVPLVLCDPLD